MDRQIRNAERSLDNLEEIQRIKCRGGQHAWDGGHKTWDASGKPILQRICWKCPARLDINLDFIPVVDPCDCGRGPYPSPHQVFCVLQYPNKRFCFSCGRGWTVSGQTNIASW